ncbi:MAG: histidine ammonia-lyase [Synergistaceae bacterium]|jgi:histidine ammonia-lyase|nr:histidine ammonia-lyase [Synergistaceae bacterium]
MNDNTVVINGKSLSFEDVINVSRNNYGVKLGDDAIKWVHEANDLVREWAVSDSAVYGVTTGFGNLASVSIPPGDREKLQENLLRSHACGVGEPYPADVTRAIMLLRINTLSSGHSGVSLETLNALISLLNSGIHPLIPCQGSLGASGDLCPLSHLAIALFGEGDAEYGGGIVSVRKAMADAGLSPVRLGAKEGLALNNGTAVMNAVGVLALVDALALAKTADIVSAVTFEALHGVPYAFDQRTHLLRPYRGQSDAASNMRRMIEDSEIIGRFKKDRVQDAYSLRCIPQVHGASRDALNYVRSVLETEINSVTDNPLIFPAERECLSGGNFHGQPLAIAMDFFGIAVAEFANISERRQSRMVDANLSGLPPFLIEGSGLNSGFMIPQYTSASLVSENKVLAHPSSVDSIPTSADQEDHVSMGGYAARKAVNILGNAQKVIAIEILLAAQALDFTLRSFKPGGGTMRAYECFRESVPYIENDEYLHPHIIRALDVIKRGDLIRAVEQKIGELA